MTLILQSELKVEGIVGCKVPDLRTYYVKQSKIFVKALSVPYFIGIRHGNICFTSYTA